VSKKQKKKGKGRSRSRKPPPGVGLERTIARIQQLMARGSNVTHNEKLQDRVGNLRQYDVVIRGVFAGQPILGVIECKDHNRKKGPDAVEAFAKKTENLVAHLRMMVSKKGFTERAIRLAKHEGVTCLSLLPNDPAESGFSIGQM
jgi:restriction endonuclease